MSNFHSLTKALKSDLEIIDIMQMYQRTIKNNLLDEVSIYFAYKQQSKRMGYTIDQLNNYTPKWVIAKAELLGEE